MMTWFRAATLASILAMSSLTVFFTDAGYAAAQSGQLRLNSEERLIYSRAFESVIWAMPMLDVLQMRAELVKHGVSDGTLTYMGSPPTGKVELPTYNNTTPYIFGNVSLKDGPIVLEVPAASEKAKLFGSVFDVWFKAIEDFGPSGIDKGAGGKFLLLPPAFEGTAPTGYTALPSGSYEVHFLLRSVPEGEGDQGWREAVQYAKTIQLYPLAKAENPPPTKWFDVTTVEGYFHGNPMPDFSVFELINQYIQEEPTRIEDLVAHGMLKYLGIEKGKEFAPDARTREIFVAAAQDAFSDMQDYLESNGPFTQYWSDRSWGSIGLTPEIMKTGATWNFADFQDYHERAYHKYFWCVGAPKVFDSEGGGATFYVMNSVDSEGLKLDGANSYRLHLPPDVPAKDFWSIILYSTRIRSYTDSSKFGLSSKDNPLVNADGSVDLYIGPKPPPGKEANWVGTKPGDGLFIAFRFYGPTEALANRTWKLNDLEKLK